LTVCIIIYAGETLSASFLSRLPFLIQNGKSIFCSSQTRKDEKKLGSKNLITAVKTFYKST
jgi:hypothetical protein